MRYRWDDFVLDVAARRLVGRGGDVHVEPQVFDLLALLIDQRHRLVAKEELLDEVWGDQFVSESALTTRIKEARRALGDDGRTQKYIRNVHGRGYQFVGLLDTAPAERRLALDLAVDDEFPFVGRARELAVAETLLASERAAAQIFIGGLPGVGKSRLALELLQRAAATGQLVCAGRCDEHVRAPLQPLRDAVAQLAAARPDRVAEWCAGVEGPLLSMIPSLSAHVQNAPVAVDVYSGIDAFLTVVERVTADGELVLLIDDLQWSDEPTRGFLGRLNRRLADRQITSIYTFRSGRRDLPQEVGAWINSQPRRETTRRIDLGSLDESAARELAIAVLGPDRDDVVDTIKAAAGNGLLLTESIRDLQLGESPSGSVAELVVARLARQSDDVQALIRTGALLGQEFAFATAVAASDLEAGAALAAIDDAVEADLLHETASPARFRFSHQLVPQSIAAALRRSTRARIHSRCADALLAGHGDDIEIAYHRLGAVPLVALDAAVEGARVSAAKAVGRKEFDRAVPLLTRILDVGVDARTRAEVLLTIGYAIIARGTSAEAVSGFEEAAEIGRGNGWPDILADAALGHWGRSPFRRPGDTSTLRLLEEADALLGPEPSIRRARVLAKTAAFSLFNSSLSSRRALLSSALELAPDACGLDRMELLESCAVVFTCPAGVAELDSIDPELEELRRTHSTYFADAAVPESRLLMQGRGHELRSVAPFDDHRTRAQPITEWRDAVLGSTLAAFAGDFAQARLLCDEGGAIGEPYWGESSHVLHALGLLFIASTSGEWESAVGVLTLIGAASPAPVLLPPLAWALVASDDEAGARETLARLHYADIDRFGEHIIGGNALIALGESALLLDDDELAATAEKHLLPFEDIVLGVPWACSFAAADTLSRLARRRGDPHAAQLHAEVARQLYTSLDAPTLLARLN